MCLRFSWQTILKIKMFAKPWEQKDAGEKGLVNFLLSLSPKSLQELVATASKMQEAEATMHRKSFKRINLVYQHANDEYVDECNRK